MDWLESRAGISRYNNQRYLLPLGNEILVSGALCQAILIQLYRFVCTRVSAWPTSSGVFVVMCWKRDPGDRGGGHINVGPRRDRGRRSKEGGCWAYACSKAITIFKELMNKRTAGEWHRTSRNCLAAVKQIINVTRSLVVNPAHTRGSAVVCGV